MNKEWSEMNKKMQTLIGKGTTFQEGIDALIDLRTVLFEQITSIAKNYPAEAFYQMPFAGAEGYHSKTLVYSMWHIFRIEDIVAHELIAGDKQVLFKKNWLKKTKSPIITTGNELHGEEISSFSKALDTQAVYEYCRAVMESSDEILRKLTYKDLKRTFTDEDKKRILDSGSVSTDESAVWLIDYWCDKDLKGLLKMPFSRHWIMHIEAMCRITNKLSRKAKKQRLSKNSKTPDTN
ncbi:MAG: phage head-tail adapter protein [Clostridiales bacterium]|nr:phage head-tail adapter protein [Clostridiales bacterium]